MSNPQFQQETKTMDIRICCQDHPCARIAHQYNLVAKAYCDKAGFVNLLSQTDFGERWQIARKGEPCECYPSRKAQPDTASSEGARKQRFGYGIRHLSHLCTASRHMLDLVCGTETHLDLMYRT